ncbi:MAG: iron ABC transporter permease [Phycisphaerales bacterium]
MPARLVRILVQQGLVVLALGGLALFLLYPIWLTVRGGFAEDPATGAGFTLEHLLLTARDPVLRDGIFNALGIATATTILSILIALPLAMLSAKYKFPGKAFFGAAILVPLILPPFVGAIGMKAILGRAGALNELLGTDFDILGQARFWGVVLVEALHLYPIIYLNATASLANLDPALDESAENLGAGPWKRFFRITLPLIRPGLFAGGTIVFIWSFTELGTPLMFDYTTVTPVQIFTRLKEVENSAEPYALTVILLGVAALSYVVGKVVFGRKGHAMYSKASRAGGEMKLGGIAGFGACAAFAIVTGLALVPHLGVVLVSLAEPGSWYHSILPNAWTGDHYVEALSAPESFGSIKNSLFLSTAAMMLNIVIGLVIGYLIVRTTAIGRNLLDAMCMMPLAVPGLVLAFGYVAMTLRWPLSARSETLIPLGAEPSVGLDRTINFFAVLAITVAITGFVAIVGPKSMRAKVLGWGIVCGLSLSALAAITWWPIRGVLMPQWALDIPNPLAGLVSVFGSGDAPPNPFPLLIVAYAVRRLPYIVRSTVAGLEQTSGELEEAAVNLGATRVMAVRKVIVPLIMANLIAGGLLVFSFSMLEVSDSLILAQRAEDFPITKMIFEFSNRLADGPYIASAMGVWGMALLTATLFGASMMLGKRMGAIFRI